MTRTGRSAGRRACSAVVLAAIALLSFVSVGQAAESLPAWKVRQLAFPTNFSPETSPIGFATESVPQYEIEVTNLGGAKTSGAVTVIDTLPPGLTPAAENPPSMNVYTNAIIGQTVNCEAAVGQVVTCTTTEAIPPGGILAMTVPLVVSTGLQPGTSVSNEVLVSGGGAREITATQATPISNSTPPFAFLPGEAGFSASTVTDEALPANAAGSHPFALDLQANFTTLLQPGATTYFSLVPVESPRDVDFRLPPGVVVNPQATPSRCTETQLSDLGNGGGCPLSSQIGMVSTNLNVAGPNPGPIPLYNMQPPPGSPAELAFVVTETNIHVLGGLDGSFHLTSRAADLLTKIGVFGVQATLWGDPGDPQHDVQRVGAGCLGGGCSVGTRSAIPLLTMPSACSGSPMFGAEAASWENPAATPISAEAPLTDLEGNEVEVTGCNVLEFNPTISSKATTNLADSPSGLDFNLHQPQNETLEGLASAKLKNATVTLPEGMTLNPSAAGGRKACTSAQIGLLTPVNQTPIRFSQAGQTCPDSAKLGSVEVRTPLVDHPLEGTVYLAKPFDNPFDSFLAIYLAVEDEESGVVATLAGKVESNPTTGQLTTRFLESPDLPLEDVALHLFNGARAALTTPLTCGTKTTTSTLTPWSTPEGADTTPTDSFQTQVAAGGSGSCPSSEANAPNKPAFTAGTEAPQAGAYSPFVLKLTRPDGTQRLTGIDTTLPKGLAAKFAGIPYCSDAQIAQAQARSNPNQGALEQASPSCPSASEVGTVEVGAGSGPTPTYVSGHAYLAGPYKGAPLSLAIITPAVAGPFDLGAVVVRTAIYINPETAQGRAVSDPLPSILQGIPLDIRSIAVKLDRPSFTLNPTSCDPMSITGAASALTGQSAALTSPFQVGGCSALKFKPNLKISLKGGTKRHRFPALKAVLTYPKGNNANIASTQVTLPHGEFLEQGHIGTVCTRVQFAANSCPKASIYGKAKAITPLLDQPLEGPVYLRSSSHELPDLVAALDGQIDVVLAGRVDTGKGGGIRNTFEAVPDAPVSKFVLEMKGGKKGLLVNSENICRKPQRASVSFTGQNGKVSDTTPLIANSCGGKARKKGSGAKKGHKGK